MLSPVKYPTDELVLKMRRTLNNYCLRVMQRTASERSDDDIISAVTSSTSTCPSYDVSLPDVCRDTATGHTDAFILPVLRLLTTSDG